MNFDPTLVADSMVNLFGAAGAFYLAREIKRADPLGPVTKRISFALRIVSIFFLLRAYAWAMNSNFVAHVIDLIAATIPLVSLWVAEGLLRQHAPRWLKLSLMSAPLLLFILKTAPYVSDDFVSVIQVIIIVGGFTAISGLLWQRDQASLTNAENLNVRRVLLALLVLAPLIVTDFRSLLPDVPVRLGAVGALLLLYVGFGSGNLETSWWARATTIAAIAAIAAIFAVGYAAADGSGGMSQCMRVAIVSFSGLLCAAIVLESRGGVLERNRKSSMLGNINSVEDYESTLKTHPLLGGAHILKEDTLTHVTDPAFDRLLSETPVLRQSDAPWGRGTSDGGVERALSLMAAYDATHLAVLTQSPLRLLALTLPVVARDAKSEAEIQIARLAGELTFLKASKT